jgi:NitT/TauT family transport system ATP-binding protein
VTDTAVVEPVIKLRDVSRVFAVDGGGFVALSDISLEVSPGEFLSVVGPSGCGKSTMLTLIAGLAKPSAGSVEVLGKQVRSLRQDVGFIFQRDALLPWRTALQNVTMPLRFRGRGKSESVATAREWLDRVGLRGFEDRYPHQLSGGMRKRVSIAATLCYRPQVLLLDEPFGALDVQTRTLMENDLLELWDLERPTVLFITHDLEEAVGLSDRVVVMGASPGRLIGDYPVKLPRPRDLLEIRFDNDFTETHHTIWEQLRQEVVRANEH